MEVRRVSQKDKLWALIVSDDEANIIHALLDKVADNSDTNGIIVSEMLNRIKERMGNSHYQVSTPLNWPLTVRRLDTVGAGGYNKEVERERGLKNLSSADNGT